ncbi:MAG: helix-turn-helix domain-containing protein [Bacteriovoracaceae bacterium]
MKKKTKKHEEDFFKHAKKVMGVKRYKKGIQAGHELANEIRLKMAREMLGLKQTDLKGLGQAEVSKIEKRKDVKVSTLAKYAEAIGCKVKITFVDEENDEREPIAIYG